MDDIERDVIELLSSAERASGLSAAGRGLRDAAHDVVDRFARRLRADPLLPSNIAHGTGDVEDHIASYVTDLAQALIAVADAEGDVGGLLRDGLNIQDVISRLHGQQRARLHWTQSMLVREFTILRGEIETVLRRSSPGPTEVASAIALVNWLMGRAERITMQEWRAATGAV
jgi:hypothetical protein